jgi:hypothetical protein
MLFAFITLALQFAIVGLAPGHTATKRVDLVCFPRVSPVCSAHNPVVVPSERY